MVEIASLVIADPPELWSELGFEVAGGQCGIGGIAHRLGAPGAGVVAWTLRGDGGAGIHELPVGEVDAADGQVGGPDRHPNGVVAVDHVVVRTPDLGRTIDAFEAAGVAMRRTRMIGDRDNPVTQAFFVLGGTVLEVVGPASTSQPGPARFYGLAFTVAALDATAAWLGERLRPAQEAVQPGRQIATLDRSAGSTVAIAFMSPDPRRFGSGGAAPGHDPA